MKKVIIFFFLLGFTAVARQKKITIMLNPAGDAQQAGRTIEGTLERRITADCCLYLKKALEARCSGVRIILTRVPGESLQPLQNASFANRLGIDLYVSIHFFEKKQGRPAMHLYYFCLNKVTDSWNFTQTELAFIPYKKAYLTSLSHTKKIANQIKETLSKKPGTFDTHSSIGLPFSPLIGIKAPAIALEASLTSSQDWQLYAPTLIEALEAAIQSLKGR